MGPSGIGITSPRSKECPTANTDAGVTTDDNRDEVECWWWGGWCPVGLWSGMSNWVDEAVVVAVAAAAMAAANSPAEVSVLENEQQIQMVLIVLHKIIQAFLSSEAPLSV